jgi:hypothetical protein
VNKGSLRLEMGSSKGQAERDETGMQKRGRVWGYDVGLDGVRRRKQNTFSRVGLGYGAGLG